MQQPNYVYSTRWQGLLRTTGRPQGYGRAITPAQVVTEAVQRYRARTQGESAQ